MQQRSTAVGADKPHKRRAAEEAVIRHHQLEGMLHMVRTQITSKMTQVMGAPTRSNCKDWKPSDAPLATLGYDDYHYRIYRISGRNNQYKIQVHHYYDEVNWVKEKRR